MEKLENTHSQIAKHEQTQTKASNLAVAKHFDPIAAQETIQTLNDQWEQAEKDGIDLSNLTSGLQASTNDAVGSNTSEINSKKQETQNESNAASDSAQNFIRFGQALSTAQDTESLEGLKSELSSWGLSEAQQASFSSAIDNRINQNEGTSALTNSISERKESAENDISAAKSLIAFNSEIESVEASGLKSEIQLLAQPLDSGVIVADVLASGGLSNWLAQDALHDGALEQKATANRFSEEAISSVYTDSNGGEYKLYGVTGENGDQFLFTKENDNNQGTIYSGDGNQKGSIQFTETTGSYDSGNSALFSDVNAETRKDFDSLKDKVEQWKGQTQEERENQTDAFRAEQAKNTNTDSFGLDENHP